MIRSDFDISDEEFDKISIPFGNALDEYLEIILFMIGWLSMLLRVIRWMLYLREP